MVGRDLPVAAGIAPVTLAQADGSGGKVDAVAVGAGGAVRATGPGRAAGAGPLWLVSGAGVGYGVADEPTAAALGIAAAEPAPEAALRLLPADDPWIWPTRPARSTPLPADLSLRSRTAKWAWRK